MFGDIEGATIIDESTSVEAEEDKMAAALQELNSLRLSFELGVFPDLDEDAASARLAEIDDAIPQLRATTSGGAIAALAEARLQWKAWHYRPGEPGHDAMSSLLDAVDVLGASQ